MKLIKLIGLSILAIVLCVNFSSCNKNEDFSDSMPPYLKGEWYCETAGAGWFGSKGDPCTIIFEKNGATIYQEFSTQPSEKNVVTGEFRVFDDRDCNFIYNAPSFINIHKISDTSIEVRGGDGWFSLDGTYHKK